MSVLRNMALFAAGAAAALPVSALAQLDPVTPTGSHIAREPETVEQQTVRLMQRTLGDCVYARKASDADLFLDSSDQVNVDFERLGFGAQDFTDRFDLERCLGRAMRMGQRGVEMRTSPRIIRSMLAEEYYLDRHDVYPEDATSVGSKGDRFIVSGPGEQQARFMATVADCIVAEAPIAADALVRLTPGTVAERDTAGVLESAVSACLAVGDPVVLDIAQLRGLVADGLWAVARRAVPADTVEGSQ